MGTAESEGAGDGSCRKSQGGKGSHMAAVTGREYRNDFLYFALFPDTSGAEQTVIYCSGVSTTRFLPITKGRHRLGLNPAVKGLQLVNIGVRDLALSHGSTPRTEQGNDCPRFANPAEVWYSERLLIENAPAPLLGEVIQYAVIHILRKIFKAIMLDPDLPEVLLPPEELQALLERLCMQYGGEK